MSVEDLPLVLDWRNSERIRSNMYTDHVISSDEHKRWFERLDPEKSRYLVFEFEKRPVGLSYLTSINRDHSRAEWGFYLGETELPRGSGTVMGYVSLERAFDTEKLRKVYGEVLGFNEPSRKFFARLGFEADGVLRQHVIRHGHPVDVCLFSMLADEWRSNQRQRILKIIEGMQIEVG